MTEMAKKMEWNTGKQAPNKYKVKAANLTRKTKKIKQNKNIIKVDTWNLRGTNEVGKLKQLNEVAKKYGIDIVALQEMKQRGNNTVEIGDDVILSRGCKQKISGMGFMFGGEGLQHRNNKNSMGHTINAKEMGRGSDTSTSERRR
ncbi:hypothetical protein ILUMI_17542 [Ignelater luminosus]|uniref:Endonuclease/exonuclease/phosphatase domain-containing protein n=1 Tax=Ignelater luminosus TaxID=2038154 RepID=A0A8K0CNV2_IGNLU|nr:hypothetical protein ILUMI_17542 [Ignelater luminosus]